MRNSRVKAKLRRNEPVLLTTLHLTDPSLYEMASLMGFDGLWMDLEHHGYSVEKAMELMRAARVGSGIDIMARPAKALTDEGRIIVAGSAYTFTAFCFDSSGQLDPSFGTGGIADVDLTDFGEESFARAIRRDGKIVLGGHARSAMDFALVRLRKDSTPDPDFGAGGIVYTDFGTSADVIRRLVILPEDKILAVGTTREASGWKFAMARYMPDGSLDPAVRNRGVY